MIIEAVVVDRQAVRILDMALIEDAWLGSFDVPPNTGGLRRIQLGSVVYLFGEKPDDVGDVLVLNVSVFDNSSKLSNPRTLFERVIRVALRHFDRSISIPVGWQTYRSGSRLSIYAQTWSRQILQRVYFDQAPAGSSNLYAYALTLNPEEFERVPCDLELYRKAIDRVFDAALMDPPAPPAVGKFGILLSEPLGLQLAGPGTLTEWYEQRLNKEQKKFVDQVNDHPVRLRGAAGTGKTQSMAVKCLRDLYADGNGDMTIAFLTHSSALAHVVVQGMLHALDPTAQWSTMKDPNGNQKLWIGTLYELAQEKLGYVKKGLRPLSLDGGEGREYQRILILQAVTQAINDPLVALGILKDQPEFREVLLKTTEYSPLLDEIMNEFGCVLDLENIRKGTTEATQYVRGARESWQMALPSEAHRRAILEIHDIYRALLRGEKMLGMDQMVADFAQYLSTHEWEQLRERDGFDLIFVDEYHYFTRAEAMTLQSLFKPRAGKNSKWPLIMAYDLKQSTNDAAVGGGIEKFRNPGVGASVPVDLNQVFRSTPQITNFLHALDASFPAMDLEGEFATYGGHSEKENGEIPTLTVFDSDEQLVDTIFEQASRAAREFEAGGREVAVLCLNEELFDKYRVAGRISGKFVAITTREDLKDLRYAKNKCVFAMPEYVAGLQFDTVFLIHADSADYSEDHLSQGARRRYVSRVYLGASRAVQKISIASSREHGGPSSLLEDSLKDGIIKKSN